MVEKENSFGEFVKEMRLRPTVRLSLRKLAEKMEYSAPYWSDVERGFKNPPNLQKLETLSEILKLNFEEKTKMFDLAAGIGKASIAPDLPDYINNREYVVKAIRLARDVKASKSDWEEFIQTLKKKGK